MTKVCQRISLVAVLVGVLGTLPVLSAQAEPVATVISTSGEGYVEGPQGRRDLECGTPIQQGENVVIPDGSRAGLVANDVYAQLDGGTTIAIDRADSGAPVFAFAAGRARVLDTREAGEALEIRGPGVSATGLGTDTEVTVRGDRTELCEDGPTELGVRSDTGLSKARKGQCVALQAGAPPEVLTKAAGEIDLASPARCIDVAIVDHFTPGVAAPPTSISLAPIDTDRVLIGPCDDPGSGCGPGVVPRIIIEQEPVPIPLPRPGGGG